MENSKAYSVRFAAIDPYLQTNIISPCEHKAQGKELIYWGDRNEFPNYLYQLYSTVPSLRSIINGSVDYVVGDDITSTIEALNERVNKTGQTLRDIVTLIAKDYYIYGGYALQVIRNNDGTIGEIYALDMRTIRSDKENEMFYYSEEWCTKRYVAISKALVYPKFLPNALGQAEAIVYQKNTSYKTYPDPIYLASINACEVERAIDEFHLNAINNGFAGSYIVNFNNGEAEDKQMEEIEKNFNEKFAGQQNAGRIVFCWNRDKESATTLEKLEIDDFGERYQTLEKKSRQQIFTAFRANPNLFGIPTENLGFSQEEYESAFKLYNRTQVKPVQRMICDTFDRIYGQKGVLQIKPFSLEETNEQIVE